MLDDRQPATAEFGLDRPPRLILLTFLAFVATMAGIFIASGIGNALLILPPWFVAAALWATVGWAAWSAKFGKARVWEEVLDGLDLRGDERALDLGCGRGLVLLALAARLHAHPVQGVDRFRSRDQSGNARAVTEANATVLEVADRVEVHDADARSLPFGDGSFDLVTSSLLLSSLGPAEPVADVLRQVHRVLVPGGRLVLVEPGDHDAELRDAGFTVTSRSGRRWLTFPPTRATIASR